MIYSGGGDPYDHQFMGVSLSHSIMGSPHNYQVLGTSPSRKHRGGSSQSLIYGHTVEGISEPRGRAFN
jgi:hypothetical protein